ncbi:hypothetical protein FGG08_000423 [Glutinoglossum americanum]|uniref:Peptidase C15, pyroglutamyl peptidase I-like protein n=1 Tax=Glutinoglossum americanum TaxID=1670608 RepID=A0A9P8L6X6_9PEZI|nr:hypothetical protein FGG08_000423 [Glutinoglossum americanum]
MPPPAFTTEGGEEKEITILLTGFGPFGDIPTNPSWEIVSSLPPAIPRTPTTPKIRLLRPAQPLPVSYPATLSQIPPLLSAHRDVSYVIHCGVAPLWKHFAVERQAHRAGYEGRDVDGVVVGDARGEPWPEVLRTTVDVDGVLERWRGLSPGVDLRVSDDAGHYLCDFIYYCSLAHFWEKGGGNGEGERPVLFLHVPGEGLGPEAVQHGQSVTMNLIRALVSSGMSSKG